VQLIGFVKDRRKKMGSGGLVPCLLAAVMVLSHFGVKTHAGTISMSVQSGMQGSNLVIQLKNAGDEDARNVVTVIDFMGKQTQFPAMDALPPNAPRGALFPIQLDQLNGTYPAVITIGFEDLNGYLFSSVTVVPVKGGMTPFAEVMAAVDPVKVRGLSQVKIRFKSSAKSAIEGHYRLITARELICDESEGVISIPARGKAELSIPIENFSAMPGATYPCHAILEYERDGRHECVVAAGMATVYSPSVWTSGWFWIVLIMVVLGVAGSYFVTRKRGE
jgi:hypothetical protein